MKYSTHKFIIFVLIVFSASSYAQEAFNWNVHTSPKKIYDAVAVGNTIWSATGGGAFSFNTVDSTFGALTRSSGMHGITLISTTVDKYGKIWFGSSEGVIDVYDPSKNSVQTLYDIYNFNNSLKGVNSFLAMGDTIYACTDFGVILINASSLKVLDSYLKLGSFGSKTKINSIYYDGKFYVCTNLGVAIQKSGNINLASPDSWDTYSTANGMLNNTVRKIIKHKDTLVAATAGGLNYFDGTNWLDYNSDMDFISVLDIASDGTSLFAMSVEVRDQFGNVSFPSNYYEIKDGVTVQTTFPTKVAGRKIINVGATSYFATLSGLMRSTASASALIVPNSPSENQFNNLSIDVYGNLWSSSGKDNTGVGSYYYDGSVWTNINPSTLNGFPNAIYNVHCSPDTRTYFSLWGAGFIRMDSSKKYQTFNTTNTPMVGIPSYTPFLVVSDIKTDSKNNIWALNYWSGNKQTLSCLSNYKDAKDSIWYSFPNYADSTLGEGFQRLLIDQNDTKWMLFNGKSSGIYFLNENNTLAKTSDDKYGNFTNVSDLSSKVVNSFVIDKRGELWLGTSLGVYVLYDPSDVLNYSLSSIKIENIFSLRQYAINCIAVDALNRKWIGTSQGLLLVSPDGGTVLASYNTINSPLLSNQIISLAVDENKGIVYVGLENGLISFSTSAIKPNEDFSALSVYPNPFLVTNELKEITITGLVKESMIKVLNSSGKLVATIESPGGKTAKWDGRDLQHNLVSSGVYILVAYDKEGNSVGLQKLAVIRK